MKLRLTVVSMTLVLALVSLPLFALSQKTRAPRWVPDKGFWVTESNLHTPLTNTIRFYNNDGVMIYKETITGVKLNIEKRKVKMRLKKVLETSLSAWEKNGVPEENKDWVALAFKIKNVKYKM